MIPQPAARPASAARIWPPRALLFALVGVCAALNGISGRVIDNLARNHPLETLLQLGGVSAVLWFALYALIRVGYDGTPRPASRNDLLAPGGALFLALVPSPQLASVGLFLLGL